MSERPRIDGHDENKRRRMRNWAIAGVLLALVFLFYAITIVRMGRL